MSIVHRRTRMDVVSVPLRDALGNLEAISNYAGLFTSQAMSAPPATVPLLAERVAGLAASLDFPSASHSGKALTHAVEQLPRDLLFGMTDAALRDVALTAMSLLRSEEHTSELQS